MTEPKKPNLFIHLAGPQTAESSIQNYLNLYSEKLIESGLLYFKLASLASSENKYLIHEAKLTCEKISTFLKKKSINSALLCMTELYGPNHLIFITVLKQYFNLKAIIYLRKQDDVLESLYREAITCDIKKEHSNIYQFSIRNNYFDSLNYRIAIDAWEEQIGIENLFIRPYGTKYIFKNIISDILSIIYKQDDYLEGEVFDEEISPNTVLSKRASIKLAHLNKSKNKLHDSDRQRAINDLEICYPYKENEKFLTATEAKDFYSMFITSNRYLFKRHMGLSEDPFRALVTNAPEQKHCDYSDYSET
jgi:hypothetical protein